MSTLTKPALPTDIIGPYSPLIEHGEGDGHLFMDVTGTGRLFGPPVDVAWRLRRQAAADLRLAPIWAVAPNKLVAKVATRLVKPDGEYIVGAGEEVRQLQQQLQSPNLWRTPLCFPTPSLSREGQR